MGPPAKEGQFPHICFDGEVGFCDRKIAVFFIFWGEASQCEPGGVRVYVTYCVAPGASNVSPVCIECVPGGMGTYKFNAPAGRIL